MSADIVEKESVREYTIQYVANNNVLQTSIAPYGSMVKYNGKTPTYTSGETSRKYHLFDSWDKSGYVDGDKTINAIFDSCQYADKYFEGKDLSTLRPVELYMMMKLAASGIITLTDYVGAKDSLTIQLGNDFSYSEIEEQVLISEKTVFTGNNYVDTGINLLSEDRDFVLAIDYKMGTNNTINSVLAQCFSGLDTSGFKLIYSSGTRFAWGSESVSQPSSNNREMIVIRHRKGENGIHVYSSNVAGNATYYAELDGAHPMIHDVSLVFGCSKLEDGSYEQYATGTVYWSKLWYADLGDDACKQIAYWPHEEITFEVCCESNGTLKRYYLSDNSGSRSSMTFIASTALSNARRINNVSVNSGGWASYSLNAYLNNRLYNAFSSKWKQLMQQIKVKSSIGDKSTEVSSSDCYIFIPSISELGVNTNEEPYASEGTMISHMASATQRVCYTSYGVAVPYWTRSPSIGTSSSWPYVYSINTNGSAQSVTQTTNADVYVRCMISM